MLRHVALLTLAIASVAATFAGIGPEAGPEEANATEATITLSCGGYDEAGEVVNAEAAAIGEFEAPADGPIEVPEVCGGYTEDGVFIGDD